MEAAIGALDALVDAGTTEVIVSGGGEPLLHPGITDLMAALARYRSVERRLYTHGGLLERHADPVAAAFDYVRISIDAGDARTYAQLHGVPERAFSRVVAVASELANGGVPTGLSMVVTDDNGRSVTDLFDICVENDIPYLFLKPQMRGLWREPLPPLDPNRPQTVSGTAVAIRESDLRTPSGGNPPPDHISSLSVTMTPDGYVRPCCHSLSDDWRMVHICAQVDDGILGSRGDQVRRRYARSRHSCRVHDAWNLWNRSAEC